MPKFSGLKQQNYLTASAGQESGSRLAGCLYFRVSYEVLVRRWSGPQSSEGLPGLEENLAVSSFTGLMAKTRFQTGDWSKASVTQYVASLLDIHHKTAASRDRVAQPPRQALQSLGPNLTSDTLPHQPCARCGKGLHQVRKRKKTLGRQSFLAALSRRLESFLLINLL